MTIGPAWLVSASDWMPFRWIVDAVRASFGGDHDRQVMTVGAGWAALLCAAAVWWGTSTCRKENV